MAGHSSNKRLVPEPATSQPTRRALLDSPRTKRGSRRQQQQQQGRKEKEDEEEGNDAPDVKRILRRAKIQQLSDNLLTRLQYASFKLNQGWASEPLDRVQTLYKEHKRRAEHIAFPRPIPITAQEIAETHAEEAMSDDDSDDLFTSLHPEERPRINHPLPEACIPIPESKRRQGRPLPRRVSGAPSPDLAGDTSLVILGSERMHRTNDLSPQSSPPPDRTPPPLPRTPPKSGRRQKGFPTHSDREETPAPKVFSPSALYNSPPPQFCTDVGTDAGTLASTPEPKKVPVPATVSDASMTAEREVPEKEAASAMLVLHNSPVLPARSLRAGTREPRLPLPRPTQPQVARGSAKRSPQLQSCHQPRMRDGRRAIHSGSAPSSPRVGAMEFAWSPPRSVKRLGLDTDDESITPSRAGSGMRRQSPHTPKASWFGSTRHLTTPVTPSKRRTASPRAPLLPSNIQSPTLSKVPHHSWVLSTPSTCGRAGRGPDTRGARSTSPCPSGFATPSKTPGYQ